MSKDKTNIEEITPKEIYLQAFTDDGYSYKDAGEEVTWCEDKVSDGNIKYIREDQVQAECEKYLNAFVEYLKLSSIEKLQSEYKYKDKAKELVDFIAEIRFRERKKEQQIIDEVVSHGMHLTKINESGKQEWFEVKKL